MPEHPLITVFNQLVLDVVDAFGLASNDHVYSQETVVPPTVLPFAILTLAPVDFARETPITEAAEEVNWAIIGTFAVAALGSGEQFLAFQLAKYSAIHAKLTASPAYAGVGYNPYVSQFDPTQSSDAEEQKIEVSLMFRHSLTVPRGA